MLRVAIVTESFLPQVNGVTNSVVRVLETLKQQEHEAIVIAPTSVSEKHLGFNVFKAASVPVLQFPVAIPDWNLAKTLDEFRPDVVHVAAPFLLGAMAIKWAQKNNVPAVAIYQTDVAGYLDRYNLSFAKSAMEKILVSIHQGASLNLAPTKLTAQYLTDLGLDGVRVWGRGVDLDMFSPDNRASQESKSFRNMHAPDGELLIGFVGRLAAEKQVHRMAELFDYPGVRFVIIGDGPERSKLGGQFIGQPVTFTGALTGMELANAYAALDVFVHFGTEETFGQTIQEAQASGVPVIAPNSGGPSQLIQHRVNGLLVDPKLKLGYLKALSELLEEKLLRDCIIDAALGSVAGRSWASNNQKLIDFYLEAMEIASVKADLILN